jgi:2-oxoacid:acceptor oxidoreductase gamma subunit (pyruvate/2-ketoisovalerate family)
MIEIVFFARGGQGAVTASQILATAAFQEGRYAQAFPSFGVERRGAPVTAYARIDERPIMERSTIVKADYVIVLAPSLLKSSKPLDVLREGGCALLNVDHPLQDVHGERPAGLTIFCIDASSISDLVYGKRSIPLTNIAMLGAFASVSDIVRLGTVLDVVDQHFSGEAAENAKETARVAFERMEKNLRVNIAEKEHRFYD